ncbi:MAG TPA: EAL domain-containing protein [Symbiobacteriaceae bacterium]
MAIFELGLGLGVYLWPDAFQTPLYAGLAPWFDWFSAAMVAGGVALLLRARYASPPWLRGALCVPAAAAMGWLGWYLFVAGNGPAAVAVGVNALGIMAPTLSVSDSADSPDLSIAMTSLAQIAMGIVLVLFPHLLAAPMYGAMTAGRLWLGPVGILSGIVLMVPLLRGKPASDYGLPWLFAGTIFAFVFGIGIMAVELVSGLLVCALVLGFIGIVAGRVNVQPGDHREPPVGSETPPTEYIEMVGWTLVLIVVVLTGIGPAGAVQRPVVSSLFVLLVVGYNTVIPLLEAPLLTPERRSAALAGMYLLALGVLHIDGGYLSQATLMLFIILPLLTFPIETREGQVGLVLSVVFLVAGETGQLLLAPAGSRALMTRAGIETLLVITLLAIGVVGRLRYSKLRRTLGNRERLLQSFLDHWPGAAFVREPQGQYLLVNRWYEKLVDRPLAEIVGKRCDELFPPDQAAELTRDDLAIMEGREPLVTERTVVMADGEHSLLSVNFPLRDEDGVSYAVGGLATDITDRKQMEAALRDKEAQYRTLADTARDGIIMLNEDGTIVLANPAAELLFGYAPHGLTGKHAVTLVSRTRAESVRTWWTSYLSGANNRRQKPAQTLGLHTAGHEIPIEISMGESRRNGERVFIAVVRDITERKHAADQLAFQAFHDSLTGLANRSLLLDQLQTLPGTEQVALLYIDLDEFKFVNDTFGHAVGDEILKAVAGRLAPIVPRDGLAVRLGGDEFAILLHNPATTEAVLEFAQQVLGLLSEPFRLASQAFAVTPSIGIAISEPPLAPADLVRYADVAMYQAKRNGRARVEVFVPALMDVVVERHNLAQSIRQGLEDGQFELYYQPIIDLTSLRCVAAEALVRWRHPTRGLVPPGEFIPIAEDTGLILPMGQWIFAEACRHARGWADAYGPDAPKVSINLSIRQMRDPALVPDISAILAETGVSPEQIQVEVTETIAADALTLQCAKRLRALGLRLALDDFGTGYSSLSYLRMLPIDILKVDRAFILAADDGGSGRAILQAIASLGRAAGLSLTLEGAETAEQVAVARELGFCRVQGYHFARPMPAAAFVRWLAERAEAELAERAAAG